MTSLQKRILIADDSPTILKLMESKLIEKNYQVIKAENGFEALKHVYQYMPDLIILDILMPLMTGYQVCRILKNHKIFRNIPIIIFTTLESKDKEFRALKTGADIYLQKPVSSDELYRVLDNLFQEYSHKISEENFLKKRRNDFNNSVEQILFEINEILDDRLHELTVFKEVASLVQSVDSNIIIIRDFFNLLSQVCSFCLGAVLQLIDNKPVMYLYGDKKVLTEENIEWIINEACINMNMSDSFDNFKFNPENVQRVITETTDNFTNNIVIKSKLIRSLIVKGKSRGLLLIASHNLNAFDSDTHNILDLMSDQAAVILDHARLYENLQHFSQNQTVRLETVYEIGRLMSSSTDVSDLLSIIVEVITKVMSANKCSIFMIDRRTMNFFLKLGIGIPSEVLMRPEIKIDENSVSGWVVKNRKPLLIDDISEDKRFSGKSLGNYSSDSLMCVPIISKETVLGVISVTDRKTGISFSQADLELLAMLGNLIAVIIENIKLYNKMKITIDKLNKKNLEISSLSELDDFLGSLNDEIEVANYSIINSIEFLKAEYGSIYFINSKTDKMEKISQAGKIKSNQKISEFEIKAFKMIQENRRSCIVNSENPPVGFDSILIEENIIQGFMILPMINEKELYGAMFFINKRFGNDFNTSDLKFASALSDLILRRIERKRLYRMIILNRETGLYKKDFFIARLCEEISRARRYSREISLAAFIIEGYEILSASIKESEKNNFFQKLASIFTDHIRQVDMVTMHDDARFLFLLPETGIQGARIFSERLINKLDAFQESIFFDRKFDFYAGISVYSGEIKGISEKEIIYQAFYAADEAAAEGGQRVLLFNE